MDYSPDDQHCAGPSNWTCFPANSEWCQEQVVSYRDMNIKQEVQVQSVGRMNIAECSQCRFKNILVEDLFIKLDNQILNLIEENNSLKQQLKLYQEKTWEMSKGAASPPHTVVKKLSPNAREFNPVKQEVPVVSIKMRQQTDVNTYDIESTEKMVSNEECNSSEDKPMQQTASYASIAHHKDIAAAGSSSKPNSSDQVNNNEKQKYKGSSQHLGDSNRRNNFNNGTQRKSNWREPVKQVDRIPQGNKDKHLSPNFGEESGSNNKFGKVGKLQDNNKKPHPKYVKPGQRKIYRYDELKSVPDNIIKECNGDLFTAPPEYSLAHCVAKDFRMGSGIAVRFKQEFRRTGELLDQNVDVGGCAYLEDKKNSRYIFYLVTKPLSSGKPTYESLGKSLAALKEKCLNLAVTKLAIPHIGCGLDRLDWDNVKNCINSSFKDCNIEICAYDFNVEGLPEAEGNRPGRGGPHVVYKIMNLHTIDSYTVLSFFGTEDGYMDTTAKSLDEKFQFLTYYKTAKKSVGDIWSYRTQTNDYLIVSLIVSKSYKKDGISFINVESCCRNLVKVIRKEEFEFMGIECLLDWSDDTTFTEKIVSLLRHMLSRPIGELWVCYREEKEDVYKLCNRFASRNSNV